nr:PREDICTED: putative nuclease HARBI1 [Linepithema humile]
MKPAYGIPAYGVKELGQSQALRPLSVWQQKHRLSQGARLWLDNFNIEKRFAQEASNNLVQEMTFEDVEKFFNYFRMTPETFEKLLHIVSPHIQKQFVIREPISARTRLQICLRYLSSGDSIVSISYAFRVGHNTVSKIVSETCDVIWDTLKDMVFLKATEDNWRRIADEFEEKCNFPNCIGAIDGKHIILQASPNSGSMYYNYKGTHSLVLMVIVDANYRISLLDIGAPGRRSDSGVFYASEIGKRLQNGTLSIPLPKPVEHGGQVLPFILVGDEAFPLTQYMLRPYPRSGRLNRRKNVFNYCLSRACKIVENVFGILSARMRIFRKPIIASIPTATRIIKATTCLHNFIISQELKQPHTQRRYMTLNAHERELRDIGMEDVGTFDRSIRKIVLK